MLDISSAIDGATSFQSCLTFVKSVFSAFSASFTSKTIRFGLVTFSSSASVVFGFSQYSSFSEVEGAIMGVKQASGSCAAGAALTTCKSSLFAAGSSGGSSAGGSEGGAGAGAGGGASGSASASARLLVVLMAGKSTDDVSASASALKEMSVSLPFKFIFSFLVMI